MSRACELKFARTNEGYRLRVEGCGTMQQSRTVEAFVNEALAYLDRVVTIDLSATSYLDSTFLGCLLGLHRRYQSRLRVAAPAEAVRQLFGPTKLDLAIKVTQEFPAIVGDYISLPCESVNPIDMARHMMECHVRLAEVPGPQQEMFAAIARQMRANWNDALEIVKRPDPSRIVIFSKHSTDRRVKNHGIRYWSS